jgi:hypothetical protein
MQSFPIDETENHYYNIKDMFEMNPTFFYGCTVKKRQIIQRKKIPESEYVYATFIAKTKEWKLSDETCKKAQLLITKKWVDEHFFEKTKPIVKPGEIEEDTLEEAPPLLILDESEKFKDDHGNILNVEVRGERSRDKVYFNVQDVMVAFQMPNLDITLREQRTNYEKNIHYKCFIRSQQHNVLSQSNKPKTYTDLVTSIQKTSKTLYLTYKGLLRVLFASRSGNAERFQDWAEETLFTIQMGTLEKKEELGARILNIHVDNYRAVFSKYSQSFPCIYLLSLGKVGELKTELGISSDIDDSLTVYKYGHTIDMKRRLGEHGKDYSKYKSVNLDLEVFNYIDSKYTSEAEGDIRNMFDSFGKSLMIDGRNELVALNTKEFDRIKKEYTRTGREYAGATQILQEEITKLTNELKFSKLETERYKTLVETNQIIYQLKEANYELQLKLLTPC